MNEACNDRYIFPSWPNPISYAMKIIKTDYTLLVTNWALMIICHYLMKDRLCGRNVVNVSLLLNFYMSYGVPMGQSVSIFIIQLCSLDNTFKCTANFDIHSLNTHKVQVRQVYLYQSDNDYTCYWIKFLIDTRVMVTKVSIVAAHGYIIRMGHSSRVRG